MHKARQRERKRDERNLLSVSLLALKGGKNLLELPGNVALMIWLFIGCLLMFD